MRINSYVEFAERAFRARRRFMALGPPGCGKTFGKMQAATAAGFDYIGLCSALEDPSSIRGYPSRGTDGTASHCLFDGIARAFAATKPTVLDFDDLGMASDMTKRSIMRLFQFGEIDGRKLPEYVVLSASSNEVGTGCSVDGMLEPLKNRFHTIVEVETHLDDVMTHALVFGWPDCLRAYLRNTPEALFDWKPSKSLKIEGATPRGWEYCAEWINIGETDPEVIAGCVGKGRASQYLAFRELINDLPDIDVVLLDPEQAPVPENPSARLLISMALASRMTASNFGSCVRYLNRVPAMFRAYGIRDAFRAEAQKRKNGTLPKDWKPLSTSRDFTAWVVSDDGKDVLGTQA